MTSQITQVFDVGLARGKGWGSGAWCSWVVVGLFLYSDVLLLYFLHFKEVG